MARLLIGTVFAESHFNNKWCELQKKFIAKTTKNYDLIAYLNRVPLDDIKEYHVIGQNNGPKPSSFTEMSQEHCRGLNFLLEEFKKNEEYTNMLILDSDCFPIQEWQQTLADKKAAAVIRFENLTTFPHPSVFYIHRDILKESWFAIELGRSTNLLDREIYDTCGSLPTNKFYPLIRTNEWNPHPVFFGIYGNMFYHHACGSREPHFRAEEYYSKKYNVARYWDKFFQAPEYFINRLAGVDKMPTIL